MASQKLKRKALRNRVKAKVRLQNIKALQSKPVLKNVDIEALKAAFKKKPAKKEEIVAEPVAETPVVVEEKAVTKEKAVAKPKAEKSDAEKAEVKPKAKKKPAAKKEEKK